MTWTLALAVILGALLAALLFLKPKRKGVKAPCIGSYPLVGSYFHVREPLTETIVQDFPDAPVVKVNLGLKTSYYFNTSAAIREAFIDKGDKFLGRQEMIVSRRLFGNAEGIAMAEGDVWKEYRRFSLKTLRDFGFGRKGAEEIISFEAQNLVGLIQGQLGKPVDISFQLSVSVSNVICQLVFGSRLASEDADFKKIADIFKRLTQNEEGRKAQFLLASSSVILKRLPFLSEIVAKMGPTKKIFEDVKTLFSYCFSKISEHRSHMDPNAEAKDFIEAHLQYQQGKEKMFTDKRLTMTIRDLFIAGTDTTSHTLRWALLYMVAFPEVAQKVVEEIQAEIGSRPPEMSDKSKMNYVNATIEEIHRLASLAPEGVPHRATEDTTVAGFCIEKDSHVKANIQAVHYNPKVFPDPCKMSPERHLTPEGIFRPHEDVMPFGVGKRACLGESLARMELFLFFVSILQRFRIQLAPGGRSVEKLLKDCKLFGGGIRAAHNHELIFEERV